MTVAGRRDRRAEGSVVERAGRSNPARWRRRSRRLALHSSKLLRSLIDQLDLSSRLGSDQMPVDLMQLLCDPPLDAVDSLADGANLLKSQFSFRPWLQPKKNCLPAMGPVCVVVVMWREKPCWRAAAQAWILKSLCVGAENPFVGEGISRGPDCGKEGKG